VELATEQAEEEAAVGSVGAALASTGYEAAAATAPVAVSAAAAVAAEAETTTGAVVSQEEPGP